MMLSAAIALGSGNKAKAINARGETVVVQEIISHPAQFLDWNLHLWIIGVDGHCMETDIHFRDGRKLIEIYGVDPSENIWESV